MRRFAMLLALAMALAVPTLSFAREPRLGAHTPAPAATVLDHRETVLIDASRRATRTVSWTVRVEDPEGCAAGIFAPSGLDGASSQGAVVLEGVLVLPRSARVGDTFTLTATSRASGTAHSGAFTTAPDLPVVSAVFEVRAASTLQVWFDPDGAPSYGTRGGRSVTLAWSDLAPQGSVRAVWSTWEDWNAPGLALERHVDGLLASKDDLGRVLGADIQDLDVRSVVARVYQQVALEPGPSTTWTDALPARDVARQASATVADRAVLLLSLLRSAGHDARPASFRPSADGDAFPVAVPAPSLFPRPAIVVRDDDGTFFIDPASDLAEIHDVPASMAGGIVWVPGDLPTPLHPRDLVDGEVTILGDLTVAPDGSASWTATIGATGAAREWLRRLLAPLDALDRVEALRRLARAARPTLDRFTVIATGVEHPDKPLRITVSGHDTEALSPFGDGLAGSIPSLFAPALAAWLPPHLRVHESLAITPPGHLAVLAVRPPRPASTTEAVVSRGITRQGQRQVFVVEVERPYRTTSAAVEMAAKRVLDAHARQGAEIVMVGPVGTRSIRALRALDRGPADRAALETLLWLSVHNTSQVSKALRTSGVPLSEILSSLEGFHSPGDPLPWSVVARAAGARMDASARLRIAEAMERSGLRREAWRLASELQYASEAQVRASALLRMARLQGDQPSDHPVDGAFWREPAGLLASAIEASPHDPDVVARHARSAMASGDLAQAETLLEGALARRPDPALEIVLAEVGAAAGLAVDDVSARIRAAVTQAPGDDRVLATAGTALATLGRFAEAVPYAVTAARMLGSDPARWSTVVDLAWAAGDASMAAYAARRASDLDPTHAARGHALARAAATVEDEQGFDLGRQRAGLARTTRVWPQGVDQLERDAPPEHLYAILVHRDAEVVASPRRLARRAQLHLERGRMDDAVRDGALLVGRHGVAEGQALAFAATAGQLFSTTAAQALDSAASSDPTARLTRMEYRLVTGAGDAAADAAALDDPRAAIVATLRSAPTEVAAGVEGWPPDIPTPNGAPPRGYRPNRLLGGVPGVAAWSDPDGATAILRVGAVTGLLPPPIANLYTASDKPVKRRDDGGQVMRLDGGIIPLFAATVVVDGQEVFGLGFTAESAERALHHAL